MPYRLYDAGALGLDLARTPGGVEAAGVLLRVLVAGAHEVHEPVPARADLVPARARARVLLGPDGPRVVDLTGAEDAAEARRAQRAGPTPVVGLRPVVGPVGDDVSSRRFRRLSRRLGAVSFGTVTDLLDLGRRLGDAYPAAPAVLGEVVADALLAALVRPHPHPSAPALARTLAHRLDPPAPALPALAPLLPPGRALLGAGTSAVVVGVVSLLGRIVAASEDVLLLPSRPPAQVWAEQAHSATWAVEVTGRTRLAAAAQLDLLRSLHAAGVGEAACLGGVWTLCTAAVQAQVVADVLPSRTYELLCADLLEVLPG